MRLRHLKSVVEPVCSPFEGQILIQCRYHTWKGLWQRFGFFGMASQSVWKCVSSCRFFQSFWVHIVRHDLVSLDMRINNRVWQNIGCTCHMVLDDGLLVKGLGRTKWKIWKISKLDQGCVCVFGRFVAILFDQKLVNFPASFREPLCCMVAALRAAPRDFCLQNKLIHVADDHHSSADKCAHGGADTAHGSAHGSADTCSDRMRNGCTMAP